PVNVIAWLVENPALATRVPPPRLKVPAPRMPGTRRAPPVRLYVPPPPPSEKTLVTVFVPPDCVKMPEPEPLMLSVPAESRPLLRLYDPLLPALYPRYRAPEEESELVPPACVKLPVPE